MALMQKDFEFSVAEDAQSAEIRRPLAGDCGKGTKPDSETRWNRLRTLLLDTWLLEFGAVIVAAVAWFSVLALLLAYHGRPTTDWSHSISINAVISFLATIMKGSILMVVGSCLGQWKWIWFSGQPRTLNDFDVFDSASKGILGACSLLYRTKARSLAGIGSIVMLISLGYDAFFQQSVSFPLAEVDLSLDWVDYITTVPYAQLYRDLDSNSTDLIRLKAAIYDGAMYTNVSQTGVAITALCPTGNCTFPAWASLAMCSKCEDISSMLRQHCETPAGNDAGTCIQSVSLPNGLSLSNSQFLSGVFNMTTTPSGYGIFPNVTEGQWISPLSAIIVPNNASAKDNPDPTKGVDYFKYATAYDCIFNFCVQALQGAEFFGIYSETIVDTYFADQPWQATNISSESQWQSYELPEHWNDTFGRTADPMNLTFSVAPQGAYMLSLTLKTLLNNQMGYSQGGVDSFNKDIGEAIFQHGAEMFPWSVNNISTAITNHIRLRALEWIDGTAELKTPHVHFRWPWLLLPMAGLLATAGFLAVTVYRTQALRLPCWKSSVLPTMQYGTKFAELDEDASRLVNISSLTTLASSKFGTVRGRNAGLKLTPG